MEKDLHEIYDCQIHASNDGCCCFLLFCFSMNHFLGVVFYDGPIYIEKTWFNGFETVAEEYAGAALGFNPRNKFTSSIVSNVTDLRFGFIDKVRHLNPVVQIL